MKDMPVIGFVGGGRMAEAMIRGLLASHYLTTDRIWVAEAIPDRRAQLAKSHGITVVPTIPELVAGSGAVVIAVKPGDVPQVLAEMAPSIGVRPVISIAAGITIRSLAKGLRREGGIVRVMPNAPAFVGAGACAWCPGPGVGAEEEALVTRLLSAVGTATKVKEEWMDAVTAVSGSGPAYVMLFVEAMIEAGVRVGLPRDIATSLVLQTLLGSARMAAELGEHPAAIREMVTSPGGTTASALEVLESGGLRGTIMKAVLAARDRSAQLAALAKE
jgi:pyrroline-5-carboxylate reductase